MYLLILSMCLFIGLVLNQLFTLSSCHIIIVFLHVRCIPISQFDKTVPSKCVCVCAPSVYVFYLAMQKYDETGSSNQDMGDVPGYN